MADVEMDNDSDPIMASYDVYIKPHISEDRQIYILQFPNRASDQHYSAAYEAKPQKLRVKEQTGMVELDVPVDAWRNYDREKGIKWGQAINKSNNAKGGGSHGLPGGFGIGGAAPGGRGRAKGEEAQMQNQQAMLNDYAGSIQRDQVLTKQTLGGQTVSNAATTPRYFIGAFRKSMYSYISCFACFY
jgi:DNA-directed RNA polymerase-3 subunit RPC5